MKYFKKIAFVFLIITANTAMAYEPPSIKDGLSEKEYVDLFNRCFEEGQYDQCLLAGN